eukprot:7226709-Heterocapsa_arctica.AAC.1
MVGNSPASRNFDHAILQLLDGDAPPHSSAAAGSALFPIPAPASALPFTQTKDLEALRDLWANLPVHLLDPFPPAVDEWVPGFDWA